MQRIAGKDPVLITRLADYKLSEVPIGLSGSYTMAEPTVSNWDL